MPMVLSLMKAGADHVPSTLATTKPCPLNAVRPTAAAAAWRNTTPLAPLKTSLGTALSVRTCLRQRPPQVACLLQRPSARYTPCTMDSCKCIALAATALTSLCRPAICILRLWPQKGQVKHRQGYGMEASMQ